MRIDLSSTPAEAGAQLRCMSGEILPVEASRSWTPASAGVDARMESLTYFAAVGSAGTGRGFVASATCVGPPNRATVFSA